MDIFNSIWRRRGRPTKNPATKLEERSCFITQTDRDYSELLIRGDVAIKIWLPELMATIIQESCALLDTSKSDLIRQTLFTYLYGRYDWLGMFERREDQYQLNPKPVILYQSSIPKDGGPEVSRDLGKNIEDLKLWVPLKMKDDLQILAGKTGITLSEMVREIIISTFIGHTYLQERNELREMRIEIEEAAI